MKYVFFKQFSIIALLIVASSSYASNQNELPKEIAEFQKLLQEKKNESEQKKLIGPQILYAISMGVKVGIFLGGAKYLTQYIVSDPTHRIITLRYFSVNSQELVAKTLEVSAKSICALLNAEKIDKKVLADIASNLAKASLSFSAAQAADTFVENKFPSYKRETSNFSIRGFNLFEKKHLIEMPVEWGVEYAYDYLQKKV